MRSNAISDVNVFNFYIYIFVKLSVYVCTANNVLCCFCLYIY